MQCVCARESLLRWITVEHGRQKLLNPIFTNQCFSTLHLIVRKVLESLFWILFNEANSFVHKNITWIQHTNFSFNNQDSILRPYSKDVQSMNCFQVLFFHFRRSIINQWIWRHTRKSRLSEAAGNSHRKPQKKCLQEKALKWRNENSQMKPLLKERTFNKHTPQTSRYYFDTYKDLSWNDTLPWI